MILLLLLLMVMWQRWRCCCAWDWDGPGGGVWGWRRGGVAGHPMGVKISQKPKGRVGWDGGGGGGRGEVELRSGVVEEGGGRVESHPWLSLLPSRVQWIFTLAICSPLRPANAIELSSMTNWTPFYQIHPIISQFSGFISSRVEWWGGWGEGEGEKGVGYLHRPWKKKFE